MLALSIQQPWAWAILHAGKDVENRVWHTHVRGTILIHTGKKVDKDGIDYLQSIGIELPTRLKTGGIVGTAEIYDCVRSCPSKWFFGPWGFLLRNQLPLAYKPLSGQQRFFEANYRGAPTVPMTVTQLMKKCREAAATYPDGHPQLKRIMDQYLKLEKIKDKEGTYV